MQVKKCNNNVRADYVFCFNQSSYDLKHIYADFSNFCLQVLFLLLDAEAKKISPAKADKRTSKATNKYVSRQLKADHPLFDWLINCVILNHFYAIKS